MSGRWCTISRPYSVSPSSPPLSRTSSYALRSPEAPALFSYRPADLLGSGAIAVYRSRRDLHRQPKDIHRSSSSHIIMTYIFSSSLFLLQYHPYSRTCTLFSSPRFHKLSLSILYVHRDTIRIPPSTYPARLRTSFIAFVNTHILPRLLSAYLSTYLSGCQATHLLLAIQVPYMHKICMAIFQYSLNSSM